MPWTTSWTVHSRPFRHIRASNVFDDQTYTAIADAFTDIRERGKTDPSVAMTKTLGSRYDALTLGMRPSMAGAFAPMFDLPWLTQLAEAAGVDRRVSTAVDGGMHHVPKGSKSGWVHNDCCSGWFDGAATDGTVLFPDRRRCDYFTGRAKKDDATPTEYVRAATMIFYLLNDGWKPGMGGETGLYPGSRASFGGEALVPPVNNSLLLFECSPHSYHRLITNPGMARNSIILWLHYPVDTADALWGNAITRRSSP